MYNLVTTAPRRLRTSTQRPYTHGGLRPSQRTRTTMRMTFAELITAYIEEQLKGKPSHPKMLCVASQWIRTLTTTPTRAEILARQHAICAGHFQPNATKANKELALIRAAC